MNYSQALKFLDKVELFGIKLGLNNIRNLLKKLNNPHKKLKFIHVAGTNGKGSVCAMISSVLHKAGFKVGMYTSPHLFDIKERFRINNNNISTNDFLKYFNKVKKIYKDETYFEFLTAMAFLYFKEKNVDIAVIEVGMGGRLDATNVVNPLISVITPISLEHTQYLGNTIEEISYEKAAIIKRNRPCITSNHGVALKVIKKYCKKKNSKLFLLNNFKVIKKTQIRTNLLGEFQKINAQTAVKAIGILIDRYNFKVNNKQIAKGLMDVHWPGRFQLKGRFIFDCCHNPASAKVLVKEVKNLGIKKVTLIVGILNDKDFKGMVKEFKKITNLAICTKPPTKRALDPNIIKEEFKKYNIKTLVIDDPVKAIAYVKAIRTNILATGSIYLIGKVLKNEL